MKVPERAKVEEVLKVLCEYGDPPFLHSEEIAKLSCGAVTREEVDAIIPRIIEDGCVESNPFMPNYWRITHAGRLVMDTVSR